MKSYHGNIGLDYAVGEKKHVDAVFSVPNFFFGVKIEDLH